MKSTYLWNIVHTLVSREQDYASTTWKRMMAIKGSVEANMCVRLSEGNVSFWFGNLGRSFGGGVLRDHHGYIVFAFSTFYSNAGTSLMVAAKVLLKGLQLSHQKGIHDIIIALDSKVLFVHMYREAHRLADFLANLGASGRSNVFDGSSIPSYGKSIMALDQAGFPQIRCR
ncbi:hypothetical protein ACH5RR_006939 [Cinchona calisaya]|uniref:RNase H type-1 domain-containing protein n=1 Tax=Cinchona calisaya TaxID=153742 RepID=A0ABD3AQR0_9GENT